MFHSAQILVDINVKPKCELLQQQLFLISDGRLSTAVRFFTCYVGLNFVRERIMRGHYGFRICPAFIKGFHRERLKFKDVDGQWRCDDVMMWNAYKVCCILIH